MKLIEGVVEAISAKDIPGGEDQWGNTCRLSIKVGEDWIGIGTAKKPEVNIKEGAGWHKLAKGDTIAVVVEENGQWLNAKRGDIKVKAKGSSGTSSTPSSSSTRQSTGTASNAGQNKQGAGGTDWARKDAGAAASASIDKALRYIELRNGELKTDYATVLSVARDMQKMVKTLAEEILNEGKTPVKGDSDGGKDDGNPGPKPPMTNGLSKARGGKPKPVEPEPGDFTDDEDLF